MEKHRIGIIGCGGIANGKHMPTLAKMKDVEMVAFCDLIPERAEEACKKYGAPGAKCYTDYKELLKDPTIESVRVLTQNRWHCRITVDALDAGKHVLVEKPMCITSEEAKEMIAARDRSGKILAVGYLYTYAITDIENGEKIQFRVTPVLTCTDGRVVTGMTRSLFYCVAD